MSKAHDVGKGIILTYFTPIYVRTMPRAGKTNLAPRRLILERERISIAFNVRMVPAA